MSRTVLQSIGAMRERLTIVSPDPVAVRVVTLTRVSTLATATTLVAHGFATGDYVTIAGASPAGYLGTVLITVTGPTTFTYAVADTLTTPATGIITATYVSNAQGGRAPVWTTVDTVPAELVPVRAWERLQSAAMQAEVGYRFRIRTRPDVTGRCRALWTPTWPPDATAKTLEIHGILPDGDGRHWMLLECGEVA